MTLIYATVGSFFLSLLLVGVLKQYLGQKLLDIPNARSSHSQPTPRGGGLGFVIAFAISSAFLLIPQDPLHYLYLWLVLTPLAAISLLDDYRGVPALPRYSVQIICATIAIIEFGYFQLPWGSLIAMVLSGIAITALINFYNFMDGLDGLVAGCSIIQLGFLAFYLSQPLLWLAAAAVLGFLWWNWSPAKIFMGDIGSTFLGALIGLSFLNQDPRLEWCALAITLPLIADAIYTLVRRLLARENIFQAHRTHLYQRLQKSEGSHGKVSIIYMMVNLVIGLLILQLGSMGALVSLVIILIGITSGEIYLKSSSAQAI